MTYNKTLGKLYKGTIGIPLLVFKITWNPWHTAAGSKIHA
jgi:hypothetical protein